MKPGSLQKTTNHLKKPLSAFAGAWKCLKTGPCVLVIKHPEPRSDSAVLPRGCALNFGFIFNSIYNMCIQKENTLNLGFFPVIFFFFF